MRDADSVLSGVLAGVPPGKALDLAAGTGRHSRWLADCGWEVTAVDIQIQFEEIPGVRCICADLENHAYEISPGVWDLIVCWLYWQADLLPEIARGVRSGGRVALAGKTSGRFATSAAQFREAFHEWTEIASGQNESRAFFIATKELVD